LWLVAFRCGVVCVEFEFEVGLRLLNQRCSLSRLCCAEGGAARSVEGELEVEPLRKKLSITVEGAAEWLGGRDVCQECIRRW